MSLRKKRILLGIIAWAAALSLSGCMKNAEHYRKVETGAVRYYKKKYGDRVTVEKSIIAGDPGLFSPGIPYEKTAVLLRHPEILKAFAFAVGEQLLRKIIVPAYDCNVMSVMPFSVVSWSGVIIERLFSVRSSIIRDER